MIRRMIIAMANAIITSLCVTMVRMMIRYKFNNEKLGYCKENDGLCGQFIFGSFQISLLHQQLRRMLGDLRSDHGFQVT